MTVFGSRPEVENNRSLMAELALMRPLSCPLPPFDSMAYAATASAAPFSIRPARSQNHVEPGWAYRNIRCHA